MLEVKQRVRELGPWALAGFVVAPLVYMLVRAWLSR